MLAVLTTDSDANDDDPVGDSPTERAELSAILYALTGDSVRRSITEAALGQCVPAWRAATTAADATLADIGTSASEQAQFDANWLGQRISMLTTPDMPTPARALLQAASQAIEAASILLAIARDPASAGARESWPTALDDLAHAFHLVNDEHSDLTQPIR